MKNNLLLFFLLGIFLGCKEIPLYGQQDCSHKTYTYLDVDDLPKIKDYFGTLGQYLGENIKWPITFDGQGEVFFSFIIDCEGNVKDVKIIKGLFIDCDEEVVTVLKGMPKWKPGKIKGKSVDVKFYYSFSFQLK